MKYVFFTCQNQTVRLKDSKYHAAGNSYNHTYEIRHSDRNEKNRVDGQVNNAGMAAAMGREEMKGKHSGYLEGMPGLRGLCVCGGWWGDRRCTFWR